MMDYYFDIGGSVACVADPEGILEITGSILAPFCIAPAVSDFQLTVELADQLETPESPVVFDSPERRVYALSGGYKSLVGSLDAPYMEIHRRGAVSKVRILRAAAVNGISAKILLRAMEVEHRIVQSKGILLHSSFICYEGQAILFTAPSGTGKSTQAELWRKERGAEIINGDRSAVKKGDAGFEARGVPFSGSSGIYGPAQLPLKAIVVLSQAEENSIVPLTGVRAFRAIWEGCSFHTWNKTDVSLCSQTVAELISQVPIFYLSCTPDERAVETLEAAMKN